MRPATSNLRLSGVALWLAAVALACGEPSPRPLNPRIQQANPIQGYFIGIRVNDLVLTDTLGTTHSIASDRGKIVVLEFWRSRCPYVERSEKARRQLIAKYTPRDVVYRAVDSNRDESPRENREYLKEHGSSYTVFMDFWSPVARQFNATHTPQVFVLDREGVLRFMGSPFSPEQWAKQEPDRADWLEQALDALLAGRLPDPAVRPPAGAHIRLFRWP